MTPAAETDAAQYRRPGFKFFTPTPTRWGDCDMFGHVNNVQFVRYFESGRLDYFHRLLDMAMGPQVHDSLIIADLHVNFLRQIHHPAALEVGTRISRLGNKSFEIEAAIFGADDDEPYATARAACVWFSYRDNRSMPIPAAVREIISEFEGISA